MAENGEEKLLAVARHIAKTLGRDEYMTDDILQIFSNFDGRFSREKLSGKALADDPRACANLERSLKALDRQISQFLTSDRPIWANSSDSSTFLDAIDELVATIRDWTPMAGDKTVGACLLRADDLMQQVMFRVEEEFRSLMLRGCESYDVSRPYRNAESTGNFSYDSEDDEDEETGGIMGNSDDHQIPIAQPLTDFDIIIDALPSGTISDLHEMAKRMVTAGFAKKCSQVYGSCRREFLEESLSRLGLLNLNPEDAQKLQWQDLEDEIERWIKAVNVAVRILFPSERRLCDRVFVGLSSSADLSFMEVCRGSTIQLLNFANAVAVGSRLPERLFKIIDLFETLKDLMPEFETLFSDQYSLFIRNEAMTIWKRLGDSAKGIFVELENLIRRDPPKAAVPGGGLHPITRYVMNYLLAASRCRQTLEQIFEETVIPSKEYMKLDKRSTSSSLSVQMDWIMDLLESNLETKSKIYKDSALCYFFMMNNGRYIVQKVEDSELGMLLGDDWLRKHLAKLRQYHANYFRNSWNKIVAILMVENTPLGSNAAANSISLKDKLRNFNMFFEEMCNTQSTWVVFDGQLREELRIAVSKNLLPAYQNFLVRCLNPSENGKHASRYVKYTVEDIEAWINKLFRGNGGSAGAQK